MTREEQAPCPARKAQICREAMRDEQTRQAKNNRGRKSLREAESEPQEKGDKVTEESRQTEVEGLMMSLNESHIDRVDQGAEPERAKSV